MGKFLNDEGIAVIFLPNRHPLERLLSAYLYIFIDEVKSEQHQLKMIIIVV